MTYEAWSKTVSKGLVNGPIGEEIAYLSHPNKVFSTLNAVVNRVQPIDSAGEVLAFQIDVTISKNDITTVEPGLDRVRLLADKRVGEPITNHEFVVSAIVNESPGYFQLICVK